MLRSVLSALSVLLLTTLMTATDSGWVPCAPLSNARYGHQAILLDNGAVLVAGGFGFHEYELNTEIYTPTTNSWATTAAMAYPHYAGWGFALVSLPNHHVLALDANQDGASRCEEYDPATATWTTIAPLPDERSGFKTVALPNGDILIAGGYTSDYMTTVSTCWVYDSQAGSWTQTGSLATNRAQFTMDLLPNGRVLATGGIALNDGSGFITSGCETYIPELGIWEASGAMSEFRWMHQSCVLRNGHVVAVSGVGNNYPTSEEFRPKSATWAATNDCTMPYEATFTAFGSGALRAGGGPWSQSPYSSSAVDLFDAKTHTWNKGPDLHEARRLAAAVTLRSGEVLVIGGTGDGFDALTGTELFGVRPKFPHTVVLAHGAVGKAFNFDVRANTTFVSYTAVGLPPGITLNQQNGHLSGNPTKAGAYWVPVTAKNAFGKARMYLVVLVAPRKHHAPLADG